MPKMNRDVPLLVKALKKYYSDAHCALYYHSPFQLLVATILSAQCTDERVNKVTPGLFKKYPSSQELAAVSQEDLEREIRSTGFFRNKAKSIRRMSKLVLEKYLGQVPRTMDELLELPGVARKTANVVLGNAFKVAVGVVVDTHVMRLSQRLGLTKHKDPKRIENDLIKKLPQSDWIWFSHALIIHGRKVCKARNPACFSCPIKEHCPNPVL
ncbi:MAG: endonuclease III [Elusimicrobiota bacterium]